MALVLQQLTSDEVVTQAKLRHGQNMGFVRRGVTGGAHQVIPFLSAGDSLTGQEQRRSNAKVRG